MRFMLLPLLLSRQIGIMRSHSTPREGMPKYALATEQGNRLVCPTA
jgi:hypothetical protein